MHRSTKLHLHLLVPFWCLMMTVIFFSASDEVRATDAPCASGNLRVKGANVTNAGRLEICHENVWGVVCANNWDKKEAKVACRQLGYEGYRRLTPQDLLTWRAHNNYTEPRTDTQKWVDNVYCHGNETSLLYCRHSSLQSRILLKHKLGETTCTTPVGHSAGIDCSDKGGVVTFIHSQTKGTHSTTATTKPTSQGMIFQATTSSTAGRNANARTTQPDPTSTAATTMEIVSSPTPQPLFVYDHYRSGSSNLSTVVTTQKHRIETNNEYNSQRRDSLSYRVPFIAVVIAIILFAIYVVHITRYARNVRNTYKQLEQQLALAEERNSQLIFMTERERASGASTTNIDEAYEKPVKQHMQTRTEETSQHFIDIYTSTGSTDASAKHIASSSPLNTVTQSTLASNDVTDHYSKPNIAITQATAIKQGDTDSEYSKIRPGSVAVVSGKPDSEELRKKTTIDVYSLPAPRCNCVSPDLDRRCESSTLDSVEDEGDEEQPVLPPKSY